MEWALKISGAQQEEGDGDTGYTMGTSVRHSGVCAPSTDSVWGLDIANNDRSGGVWASQRLGAGRRSIRRVYAG
ncbi:MAG: hypothetical protein R3C68_09060 [Myxococcota bacterium]